MPKKTIAPNKRFRANQLGPDGKPWRSRFSPARFAKPLPTTQRRPDNPNNRPNMIPFIVKVISTHKKPRPHGLKRICAVVKLLGITKTVHMDVPKEYSL